jgi:hypothetical protein
VVKDDNRERVMMLYSRGRVVTTTVRGYTPAAQIGRYLSDVGHFMRWNDPTFLAPHVGESVTDIHGHRHVFETNENRLYELHETANESIEDIYDIPGNPVS